MNTIVGQEDIIQIEINNFTEKGKGMSSYISYLIIGNDAKGEFNVERRFKEFKAIRDALRTRWPGVYIPPLP